MISILFIYYFMTLKQYYILIYIIIRYISLKIVLVFDCYYKVYHESFKYEMFWVDRGHLGTSRLQWKGSGFIWCHQESLGIVWRWHLSNYCQRNSLRRHCLWVRKVLRDLIQVWRRGVHQESPGLTYYYTSKKLNLKRIQAARNWAYKEKL